MRINKGTRARDEGQELISTFYTTFRFFPSVNLIVNAELLNLLLTAVCDLDTFKTEESIKYQASTVNGLKSAVMLNEGFAK
jgi:hypothetical protein